MTRDSQGVEFIVYDIAGSPVPSEIVARLEQAVERIIKEDENTLAYTIVYDKGE